MTRRAVQIALFASAGWLLTLVAAIVLVLAVRDVSSPPWIVIVWVIAMSVTGVFIVGGLLWLVVADTVRPARATPLDEVDQVGGAGAEDLEETEVSELASKDGEPGTGLGSVRILGPDGPEGPEGPKGPEGPEGPSAELAGSSQVPSRAPRAARPAVDLPSTSTSPGESPLLQDRLHRQQNR